jgi:hypothetical protein
MTFQIEDQGRFQGEGIGFFSELGIRRYSMGRY